MIKIRIPHKMKLLDWLRLAEKAEIQAYANRITRNWGWKKKYHHRPLPESMKTDSRRKLRNGLIVGSPSAEDFMKKHFSRNRLRRTRVIKSMI